MKKSDMKMADMKATIDDQKKRIDILRDQLRSTDMSLRLLCEEMETAHQEIEKLKAEKADLLNENIRLLEKMRCILKGGVSDGN